jgi:exopolyphosphatase/guanosine-5'-triphosphate,3'-diphosphate pyrophosphatase
MKHDTKRRRQSVLKLARQCRWHRAHSEHVTGLCLMLFDQLRELHQLDDTHRELIEYGSLLHDIGWHVSGQSHHKHSLRLIIDARLEQFSATEIHIIANIARYHRKAIPRSKHAAFAMLAEESQRTVAIGAALLRIADGLDRGHKKRIRKVRCKVGKAKVTISLAARGDVDDEMETALAKGDLFEKTFRKSLRFRRGAAM